jgi:hypothetical protein
VSSNVEHDVNSDGGLEPQAIETWYVWRRGDGFVGITNVEPTDVFTEEYTYHVLLITREYPFAIYEATLARSCN